MFMIIFLLCWLVVAVACIALTQRQARHAQLQKRTTERLMDYAKRTRKS